MKTLCMDSAHKYLVIGLYEDERLVAGVAHEAWKKQSETLFPTLIQLCDQVGWDSDSIEEVIISDGPGSYTGVRIAMCVAKVLCTRKRIPLYTISTLQLYAGLDPKAFVMLDARSQRAYTGVLERGVFTQPESILGLDAIKEWVKGGDYHVYGDASLIGCDARNTDFLQNFIALKRLAKKVDNVHALVPRYLKEQDAYKVHK